MQNSVKMTKYADLIVDKFEQLGGADDSYTDIARRAWEVGRAGFATKV
jgi:hypothetical protein